MRDKNRIQKIMTVFQEIWEQVPDWRFGQLISNMMGTLIHDHKILDIFFPEDDKWLEWLQEYKEKYFGPYEKES